MNKILYWFTTGCAALALILVVTNVCLIKGNQGIQEDITFRQNIINTAVNVSPINQQLAQALYDAAQRTNDKQIRALLTEQGFQVEEKPAAKAVAAPAKAAKPAAKATKKEGEE